MGEFTEEMGKFADLFWYYVGAGAVFTPLLFIESGGGYDSSLSDLPFAATILMTCLCLYYRPENPKRAALFGWLTLIGGGIVGSLTGTESIQPLAPTLAKWLVGMLFAFVVVRFELDRKLRAAIPHRS
ncbi:MULTISPECIES: hypothetical protein [unclassified Haladaptatus]|uniref:hypothetical protein n=1 Tax=unclassified Haladaptatus TaxID=2622732 RepID=UPI00209C4DD4|nr:MULTISPECIES: hypothetical protein [unclassified Haladaptatus]MCO8246834.1 hypothetical protein [Haladaptatus sp. AB643]MCO8253640.1 hypothetical protein [Haladaptatus sp. AB618]